MDKCCTSQPSPRAQRRINGLQLPLHCQQILGWIVFAATGALNFFVLVPIQFNALKIISDIIFGILYVSHVTSHLSALLMDPSEKELRKLKVDNVPEFDRRVHAHVIENGRCHLCNIYTSSKKTKHCSICNKCVQQFDHHCKWLNNCIGGRNYGAFISSVVTALFISSFTTSLCLVDIVYFLVHPHLLSPSAQEYINCSLIVETSYETKYCRRSITFLTFLIIFCLSAFAISCALMHLCCFHVYISVLGVSTYEYIVTASTDDSPSRCRRENFCNTNILSKIPKMSTKKMRFIKKYSQNTDANRKQTSEDTEQGQNAIKSDLSDLITTIIHSEVDKAKKIFMIDKNRIHPTTGDTTTSSL